MADLDQEAKAEIQSIPKGKRKAFVYSPASDKIAVGNTIHAVLAGKLGAGACCAGFLEFTGIAVAVIHWPDSPVDAGGKQYVNQVATKVRALGFPNVSVRRS
ncbi:MAG: hypothetical protein IPM24_16145 [Bryobacterales bacterium]|jgi:hypothetical protein|nr:hypothetical protein [Bryobacterales bacterium]